jgi:hypothetical protein
MFNSTADDQDSANTAPPHDGEASNEQHGGESDTAENLAIEKPLTTNTPAIAVATPVIVKNPSIEDPPPPLEDDDPTETRLNAVKVPASDIEHKQEALNGHTADKSSEIAHAEESEIEAQNETKGPELEDVEIPLATKTEEAGAASEALTMPSESKEDKLGGVAVAVRAENEAKAQEKVDGEHLTAPDIDLLTSERISSSLAPLTTPKKRFTRYWVLSVALLLLLLLGIVTPLTLRWFTEARP